MSELSITDALTRVKTLKGQIGQLRARATACVVHDNRVEPAYVFGACTEKADAAVAEMVRLQTAIAVKNASVHIDWEGASMPMAHAIRLKDELVAEIAWLDGLPVVAQPEVESEEWGYDAEMKRVKIVKKTTCHLPEAKRNERKDAVQARLVALHSAINRSNGKTSIQV